MNVCSTCRQLLDDVNFYKASRKKSGLQSNCKSCSAQINLKRYHSKLSSCQDYVEYKKQYDKNRRVEEAQRLRAYDKERSVRPERVALKRDWSRKRKLLVKQQTPLWADLKSIKQVYETCVVMSRKFNTNYEVDHIIPLKGKNVCGLHVENNLQILEKGLNRSKSNKCNWQLTRRKYPA